MSLPIRFQYGLPAIASFTENITGCIPRSKSRVKQIDHAKVFSVSYFLFLHCYISLELSFIDICNHSTLIERQ